MMLMLFEEVHQDDDARVVENAHIDDDVHVIEETSAVEEANLDDDEDFYYDLCWQLFWHLCWVNNYINDDSLSACNVAEVLIGVILLKQLK